MALWQVTGEETVDISVYCLYLPLSYFLNSDPVSMCFNVFFFILQWKARSEIVFFDDSPSRAVAQKRSADSFVDNVHASKRLLAGSSSASGFHVEGSCVHVSVSNFGQLDALLEKAYELSLQLPGTSARMSHVAGLLPPERCFDAEGAKDFLDLEAANLLHYQNSILHIRQGVAMLKASQDVRCRPYEDEARAFINDMNNVDFASAKTPVAAAGAGSSGDGLAPTENVITL